MERGGRSNEYGKVRRVGSKEDGTVKGSEGGVRKLEGGKGGEGKKQSGFKGEGRWGKENRGWKRVRRVRSKVDVKVRGGGVKKIEDGKG